MLLHNENIVFTSRRARLTVALELGKISLLTWFWIVIVSKCRCSSTMFVSSSMAAIFFESGTRTLLRRLPGLLMSPSSLPSWFSSFLSCLDVVASSAPVLPRTRCGLIAIGWKVAASLDVRVFESSDELMREQRVKEIDEMEKLINETTFATPHQLTLQRQIHYDDVAHTYDLALLSASLRAQLWFHAVPRSALAVLILWCESRAPRPPYHPSYPSYYHAPSAEDAHSPCWHSSVDFGMMQHHHRRHCPSSPRALAIVRQRCCGCWTFDNCLSRQLTGTFAYVSHREDSTTHYHRCHWRPNWAVHLMYLKCYCPVESDGETTTTKLCVRNFIFLERWAFNWCVAALVAEATLVVSLYLLLTWTPAEPAVDEALCASFEELVSVEKPESCMTLPLPSPPLFGSFLPLWELLRLRHNSDVDWISPTTTPLPLLPSLLIWLLFSFRLTLIPGSHSRLEIMKAR